MTIRGAAWSHGRRLRVDHLRWYMREYGVKEPPPPAAIADDLIVDLYGARLRYESLPLDRFAEATWEDDQLKITVSTRIAEIDGVKDASGVANVAKWHEMVHGGKDLEYLKSGQADMLPGFDPPARITCFRSTEKMTSRIDRDREIYAEEAARAAVVSRAALLRSDAFRELIQKHGPSPKNFPLLYQAARDIHVNPSAVVKQLRLEGAISIVRVAERDQVSVQPRLIDELGLGDKV